MTLNMFGYANPSSTLIQVITYLLGIALILASGVVALLIYSKKQSVQLAISAVKLSSSVIKKRLRVLAMPIIFIALQTLNIFVCVYFVLGLIMTGAYDIQNGFFELKTIDEEMREHGLPLESTACAFMILLGLFTYCLIVSSFQFMISSLTFQWYNDRISLQFKQRGNVALEASPKSSKLNASDRLEKSERLEKFEKFGTHHTFRRMLTNYLRQFGSLCCYSAMSILLILPHLVCWLILKVD